jgi:hypothetical protein
MTVFILSALLLLKPAIKIEKTGKSFKVSIKIR